MFPIDCDRCGGELDKPGALVFSPPLWGRKVEKFHICMTCWPEVLGWVRRPGHKE